MRVAALRALALAITLTAVASSASAQAYGTRPAYYYPSAGYYNTTAGVMYISTPGYYYNVPSAYAPRYTYAPAPSPGAAGTYYTPTTHRQYRGGHSDNPNAPAYYSGAVHSQHARGWDEGRHGR